MSGLRVGLGWLLAVMASACARHGEGLVVPANAAPAAADGGGSGATASEAGGRSAPVLAGGGRGSGMTLADVGGGNVATPALAGGGRGSGMTLAAAGGSAQPPSAGMLTANDAGAREEDAGAPPPSAASCADGLPRENTTAAAALHRLAAFTPSPADVTECADGRVFITLDGADQVWRIADDVAPVRYADVTGVQPAGIACDERGRLFVIAFGLPQGSPYAAPGVLLITDEHTPARMLPPPADGALATPNGIAAASGIGLYATDTLGGVIALIRERGGDFETTVVARDMLGVNGVAYDAAAHELYVSNSINQRVTSFSVAADGSLSASHVVWTAAGFPQLDGMVVDERGRAYVAGYGQGEVLRVPDGAVVAKVENPASLAFHGGELLVVDYHLNEPTKEGGLYAVQLGVCGAFSFDTAAAL